MKAYWTIILLLLAAFLFGQNNNWYQEVVAPPPNAASLGVYGEVPVGYHTGTPKISIPLHTLEKGDLQLPISLNYHASGIQVAQLSSWVGLGWSLDAGGVITRSVRSGPDEGNATTDGYYADYGNFFNGLPTEPELDMALSGEIDTEPDAYFFNFSGFSGKFIFDQNPKNAIKNSLFNFDFT